MTKEKMIKILKAQIESEYGVRLITCDLCSDGISIEMFLSDKVQKIRESLKDLIKDYSYDDMTQVVTIGISYGI